MKVLGLIPIGLPSSMDRRVASISPAGACPDAAMPSRILRIM
jgi:hypothetical protein